MVNKKAGGRLSILRKVAFWLIIIAWGIFVVGYTLVMFINCVYFPWAFGTAGCLIL